MIHCCSHDGQHNRRGCQCGTSNDHKCACCGGPSPEKGLHVSLIYHRAGVSLHKLAGPTYCKGQLCPILLPSRHFHLRCGRFHPRSSPAIATALVVASPSYEGMMCRPSPGEVLPSESACQVRNCRINTLQISLQLWSKDCRA